MRTEPTVFVVDDDAGVRDSLQTFLESAGLRVETYGSAEAFLAQVPGVPYGCLLLDLRMPGIDGLALQDRLLAQKIQLPIIILTGHGDVAAAVHALKGGAVDFLEKPFNTATLLERIRQALALSAETQRQSSTREHIKRRLAHLTAREREILDMVVDGRSSKVIAIDLGISERTVELHRARVKKKMGVRSVAELVRMMLAIRAPPPGPTRHPTN